MEEIASYPIVLMVQQIAHRVLHLQTHAQVEMGHKRVNIIRCQMGQQVVNKLIFLNHAQQIIVVTTKPARVVSVYFAQLQQINYVAGIILPLALVHTMLVKSADAKTLHSQVTISNILAAVPAHGIIKRMSHKAVHKPVIPACQQIRVLEHPKVK